MMILGLLLVVISGAAGVLLIAYNNDGQAQTVTLFGRDLADVTMMQAFIAGIVVTLVFMIGLWMIMSAGRRARENRSRYREARNEAKVAAAERDELAEQLRRDDEARRVENTDTMVTPPAGTPVPENHAAGAPPQPRHTAPGGQQPVITNIKPGDSPTR